MRIRRLGGADAAFLERMMVLAGFPPDRPLPPDPRSMPRVRRFVDGWGRVGDIGLTALCDTGRPLGAAWARRFAEPLLWDGAETPVAEVGSGTSVAFSTVWVG